MSTLLQEIISVYPLLNPPELSSAASNRVCNALALLQCVASHPETRDVFLKGKNPLSQLPPLCSFHAFVLGLWGANVQRTSRSSCTPSSIRPPNPVRSSTSASPPSASSARS